MPVEIKELVIRTVATGAPAQLQGGADGADCAETAAARGGGGGGEAAQTVQECVRQVLRILARDKER